MFKQKQRIDAITFVIIALNICVIDCACESASETQTNVDDYVEIISTHYQNEIQTLETQITQMELQTTKDVAAITYNQQLAANVGRRLEARMKSAARLNVKGTLCVQHFIGNVSSENLVWQTKLRACADTAKASSKTLADNARNQLKTSKNHLNDLIKVDLALCRKNNPTNQQKLFDCAKEKLKAREINVQNILKAVGKDLEGNLCKADIISRTAQECTFRASLDSQSLLSDIVGTVNTCIGERLVDIS